MSTPVPPAPPGPQDYPAWANDWALFLDIDGTLLDLAPEPWAVHVPPELPAWLKSLAQGLDGALALVSGRSLDDIDRLFCGGFDAAGTHGTQWRQGGIAMGPESKVTAALEQIDPLLQQEMARLPGIILERKSHAVALHYRLAPAREAQVRSLATRAAQTLGPTFRLQFGKQVVELLPVEASKGSAIRRFMALPPYAGRTPVFIGDDQTDEDGFAVVNGLGGLSIRVGQGPRTLARFMLHSPTAVRDWLAGLVVSLP